MHLPGDALLAPPVLHVFIAEQLDPTLRGQQLHQLLEGDDPLGVVAQHDVPGVDRIQELPKSPTGTSAVAVGRSGLHPVLSNPGFVLQPAVAAKLVVYRRFVPQGNGIEQMVVGTILVLIVGRIEVAELRRPGTDKLQRILAADLGFPRGIDHDGHLETDRGKNASQGIPAVPAETLVAGLEHPRGVGVGGALVQQGGQEEKLLLRDLSPRIHLLDPAADPVDDQGVFPCVEQTLRVVVSTLGAGRRIVT